jgi:hypothetical protein
MDVWLSSCTLEFEEKVLWLKRLEGGWFEDKIVWRRLLTLPNLGRTDELVGRVESRAEFMEAADGIKESLCINNHFFTVERLQPVLQDH